MAPIVDSSTRADDHRLLVRYFHERSPELREALVERYLPLARHLAGLYPSGGEREDLLQVAALALVKAIDRYDPGRGAAFTSFATPTILGELKRYFRDTGWSVRVPRELQERAVQVRRVSERMTARLGRAPTAEQIATEIGVEIEDVLEALETERAHRTVPLERPAPEGESEPRFVVGAEEEPGFARVDSADSFDALLALLPERERAVVELRFRDDLTQREIAQLLGVSQMQISRLLAKATARLRELVERASR